MEPAREKIMDCPTCLQSVCPVDRPLCDPVYLLNHKGTPISGSHCLSCGTFFTVCPAAKSLDEHLAEGQWSGCMAPNCVTYDLDRDMTKYFDGDGKAQVRQDEDGNYQILKPGQWI